MGDAKAVLYSYFRSSASWRVRIALAHKGVEYDYKPVHLVKAEQKGDEYTGINPMRQVPTLLIDGHTLTQSLPIIEYLEETRPAKPLLPSDPGLKAEVRRIAEIINSGIQPLQNLSVLQKLAKVTGDDALKMSWAHDWIETGFIALESEMKKTAGLYSVGDSVTMADCALVPQVYNAARFKVDMEQFPTVQKVHANLVVLEAFKAADPLQQPDCPEELK